MKKSAKSIERKEEGRQGAFGHSDGVTHSHASHELGKLEGHASRKGHHSI